MSAPARRRWCRTLAAGALAGTLVGALAGAPGAGAEPTTPGPGAGAPLSGHAVTVTVLRVDPSTPAQSNTPQPLTVSLQLTNTTDQTLDHVSVAGARGDPINSQPALDSALAAPQPPDPSLVGTLTPTPPVSTALPARGTVPVTFITTTAIPAGAGLCICADAIYPLYFTVHRVGNDGSDTVVGAGQTYVPAFVHKPQPVQVSWVWPLIDRPHRLLSGGPFLDDQLAYSVDGGRLDRLLRVVEAAGKAVPITLVIDPEVIDELASMTVGYRVQSGARTVPGTGGAAAATWLARLRAALAADPGVTVHLTAFADPDVESLTRAGLVWASTLPTAMQTQVTTALGGHLPSSDLAWPAGESASKDTLVTLVRQGAHAVLLNDTALPRGAHATPANNAVAALQTAAGPLTALVTSAAVQRPLDQVLAVGGAGLSRLPELVAQVALRAAEDGSTSRYVVLVPPRTLDPNPDVAARAILDTGATFWSTGLSVDAAAATVTPADHGTLVPPAAGSAALSPATIDAARTLTRTVPAVGSMFSVGDAAALLGSLPEAVQRSESTAWRSDRSGGATFAAVLAQRVGSLVSGVRIITPSSGTYTLASSTSPLPLTIENTLDVSVSVRVLVSSANGLPGFSARDPGVQHIAPHSKVTLRIPTQVERTGRFLVRADLLTPTRAQVGEPVLLSVHCTALGAIGVIITMVAAIVLVLALLLRLLARWRGRPPASGAGVADDAALPVGV